MNTKILTALIFSTIATQAISKAHAHGLHHGSDENFYYHEMSEEGVKLPFDSPYCDLNGNENIDADELRPDNLCIMEPTNDLFADKPIAAFGLKKGELALTIDDGPNPIVTKPILDLLDQYGIKATFFVVGSQIASNASLIREMVQRGHTIGNHTYSHNVPKITSGTIIDEILRAHKALAGALGKEPQGRLLFRAPGLAWNSMKTLNVNSNSTTRRYIGPIHANLGTDAPRADWSCWSKGVSAETCANWYFQDIVNAGRGVVLSHDIFYKEGRGNTYQMLKILLSRLDKEAGGIGNKTAGGLWKFVTFQKNAVLDKYDNSNSNSQPQPAPPSSPAPTPAPAPGIPHAGLKIKNTSVLVRSVTLANEGAITDNSKILVNGKPAISGVVLVLTDMNQPLTLGTTQFKMVRIDKTIEEFKSLEGTLAYISTKAF